MDAFSTFHSDLVIQRLVSTIREGINQRGFFVLFDEQLQLLRGEEIHSQESDLRKFAEFHVWKVKLNPGRDAAVFTNAYGR